MCSPLLLACWTTYLMFDTCAGVLWRQADEKDFPVGAHQPSLPAAARSKAQDLAAALAGAGGGRCEADEP